MKSLKLNCVSRRAVTPRVPDKFLLPGWFPTAERTDGFPGTCTMSGRNILLWWLLSALAAAANPAPLPPPDAAPVRRWKEGAPQAAPGRVLVRFKQTPAGARLSAAQARRPLPGLQLERLVGRHHTLQVPAAGGGGSSSGGATTATAAATTATSPAASLPSDAVMLFSVVDGSTVEDKVAQLRAHPGGGWSRAGLLDSDSVA